MTGLLTSANVAGLGLLLAQLQAQTDPFDLGGVLAPVQRVPRPPNQT